jgi:hypothetical protein
MIQPKSADQSRSSRLTQGMMRTIASKADPMGRDWNDRRLFDANYQYSPETRGRRHKGH